MLTLQTVFASGWLQIFILIGIFYAFSRWVFNNNAKQGYALGWLIGIFMIVAYGALFPRTALTVAVDNPTELSVMSVVLSSCTGAMIALIIIGGTVALQKAWFRQIFSTAGITAFLITMLFTMLMSPTQVKMGLTLASLSFAIAIACAYMLRRAYLHQMADDDPIINDPLPVPNDNPRIDRIREQATTANRF